MPASSYRTKKELSKAKLHMPACYKLVLFTKIMEKLNINTKLSFARKLKEITVEYNKSECHKYGIMSGCNINCPILQNGACELKETENKELYNEYLETHTS